MITMPVPPFARPAAAACASTSCAPTGSRSDSGSSSTRTRGRMASVAAIAVRCFWPPDSVTVAAVRIPASPVTSRHQSTRAAISGCGRARFSGPNATSDCTVWLISCRFGFWNTMPTSWDASCGGSPLSGRSPNMTRPAQLAVHPGRDQPAQRQRQRGLAAARGAGDQHHLARRHAEVDVPQRGPDRAVVGERDVLSASPSARRPPFDLIRGPSASDQRPHAARSRRPGRRRRPAPWPRR